MIKKKVLFVLAVTLGMLGLFSLPVKTDATLTGIYYRSHIRNIGWENGYKTNGEMSGIVKKNLPIEAFQLSYSAWPPTKDGQIVMRSHVSGSGWQSWTAGSQTGTVGQNKPMEAIQIVLSGEFAKQYNIVYRVHVSQKGWLPWVQNGETGGTVGQALAMEAIEVKLVKK